MDKNKQKHLYGWLRKQSGHGRRWIGLSIGLGMGQGILMVMQAWLLATLLHGFIIEGTTPEQSIPLFIALLLVTLTKAALAYGREVASFKAGSAVRQAIRELVLTRLARLGPAYIQRRPAGSWASLLLEQIEEMQEFFSRYLPQMAIAVFIPLVILVAVFPVNWAAGIILLGTAPLIPLFMILVGVGAADANRRNFQSLARLSGHFLDRLKGLRTLQLFMRTRAEGEAIRDASEDFRERTMEVLRLAFLSTAVLEFFAAIAVALVAVYFGFSYIDHLNFGNYGVKVTLFTGLFVLFLAPEFYAPLRELGAHYHAKAQAIGAAEQLLEFLEAEVSEPASGSAPFQADGPIRVEARALEVLSAEGKVLVGPIDFTLEAGTRTALVGISGAGKSSLVNALLGFAPYRGSLRVNGQELAELDMSQWRLQLGWLSQNPQLFHASLRDNLLLARPTASDAALEAALQAVRSHGAHAQGTLSYTTSPAHTLQTWLDLTEQLLETGVDSIAIKDMSGILTPMAAFELVSEIKKRYDVTLHLHCHATTGMAEMALLKAIEAGVDGVDTAISSMSATYGHPATEALVATLAGTEHDTGLDIHKLESIAAYFREVRKKYHAFEGQLKGTDSRILVAQVPGGMLTNLEGQLKQQNAADRLDEVLAEIPRVREDLGFIPLVTPTSQIVGTQAVLNVLTGERYKTIAKETAGILKGEYGHTPAPVNAALQARVLEGAEAITCRPADLLKPELAQLEADVRRQAQEKGITLAVNAIDDVLTVALFPQPGLKFLENRHNPAAFEPVPQAEAAQPLAKAEKPAASGVYTVEVEGKAFVVKVSDGGDVSQLTAAAPAPASAPAAAAPAQDIDLQQLGEQLNRLEQKVDRLTALLLKQQQD